MDLILPFINFSQSETGNVTESSQYSERSRQFTSNAGPVHLFIGPSKEKFVSDIGILTGARGSCQGCGLSLAQ